MLLRPLAAPADLDAFYGTTATILSATIIAAVLELRAIHKVLVDANGHIESRMHRLVLSSFYALVAVAALGLASIPGAILYGSPDGWAEPGRLVAFTSVAATIGIVLPAGFFAVLVWQRKQAPGTAPTSIALVPAAPGTATAEPQRPDRRPAACLLGFALVAAVIATRRPSAPRRS